MLNINFYIENATIAKDRSELCLKLAKIYIMYQHSLQDEIYELVL